MKTPSDYRPPLTPPKGGEQNADKHLKFAEATNKHL